MKMLSLLSMLLLIPALALANPFRPQDDPQFAPGPEAHANSGVTNYAQSGDKRAPAFMNEQGVWDPVCGCFIPHPGLNDDTAAKDAAAAANRGAGGTNAEKP